MVESFHKQRWTVIYDGTCGFCTDSVRRIRRMDQQGVFDYVPYQAKDLEARFPGIDRAACENEMFVVMPSGEIRGGPRGVAEILRACGWRVTPALMDAPGMSWFARRVYNVIAANRKSIGGTCELPEEWRA
ncbi:MAG: DUF393 domain-containing protein [Deltaproteobacteria bacterium]|nr:DUF393 domain-containing protein [Deltaproteobacteria bacterium]